jgi:hypothetical protein
VCLLPGIFLSKTGQFRVIKEYFWLPTISVDNSVGKDVGDAFKAAICKGFSYAACFLIILKYFKKQ